MKLYYILFLIACAAIASSLSGDCDCDDVRSTISEPEPELTVATLIYPRNGQAEIGRSPVFIWDGHLEDDDDGSFEFTLSVVREYPREEWLFSTGSDTIFQFPDTLDPGSSHHWQVITEASGGRSESSSMNSFTPGAGFNNPPTHAVLLTPPHNSRDNPVDVVLSWYPSIDPDGDEITYRLWYKQEWDSDSTYIEGLTTTEFTPSLSADAQYWWGIHTYDEHDAITRSYAYLFYTVSTPPPYGPYPVDGAVDQPTDIILSWSCTDPDGDALTYDIEMGRAGGSLGSIGTGLAQDELPVVGLSEGVTYEWKVTAEDDDGHRTEGPVWSFTTIGGSGVIFADLTLTRQQTKSGIELVVIDNIWARFDETYAPQWALRPLQPPSVSCEEYDLAWQASRHRYYYENAYTLSFLVPGTEYEFSVEQGNGVPALTESIIFPQCAPVITSPEPFDFVSMDGFTVTWSGYDDFTDCDRQISIAITDIGGDSTGVYVTTDNDGSYAFTAGELSVIDPSLLDLQIVLIVENVMNIDSPGYDPRSWIRARTYSAQYIYQQ